ncbi:MAG: GrpB family protein, partial [Chitinophagales bacterium]|nr:GrpB family protein [Chitinophagales bacterium]
ILVGIPNADQLDNVIEPLTEKDYIYYEKYNAAMPYRRFFVKLKKKPVNIFIPKVYFGKDEVPDALHEHTLAHIHILQYHSYHWLRHIAFREYLKQHPTIKNEYQELKIHLSTKDWKDGNAYNASKNDFIKHTEQKAFEWYEKHTSGL